MPSAYLADCCANLSPVCDDDLPLIGGQGRVALDRVTVLTDPRVITLSDDMQVGRCMIVAAVIERLTIEWRTVSLCDIFPIARERTYNSPPCDGGVGGVEADIGQWPSVGKRVEDHLRIRE